MTCPEDFTRQLHFARNPMVQEEALLSVDSDCEEFCSLEVDSVPS